MTTRGARAITYAVVAVLAFAALHMTHPIARKPAELLAAEGRADAPPVVSDSVAAIAASSQKVDTLGVGETLSQVLTRGGLQGSDAALAVRSATTLDERRVPAGVEVTVTQAPGDSVPSEITLRFDVDHLLHLRRTATGWQSQEERLPWTTDTVVAVGTIRTNLYAALDSDAASVLPKTARAELAWKMADIFEYRVDMSRDLQVGDSFRALFERQVGPGGAVRVGQVLATTFVFSRDTSRAFRFTGASGTTGYFDAAGKSMRNAFLRAPLEFRRISSVFGMREHPILGGWKQHKGTDYAAASGTPVRAIGDAVVVIAGQAHGYGNLIELRHRNGYLTRYGHLRAFARGIRPGAHVSIGQTIGYVGMTGLATGPHLHFEVLVNGVQRDPRVALKSTGGDPIPSVDRSAFQALQGQLLAGLQTPPGTAVRLALQ
ncbi:MAG TPA: M23 family metallopeptidase [Gemmatimonadaceae bacterium]|nr:M23 family metallopeptidase [Gemmatimonadaceae bacterium]